MWVLAAPDPFQIVTAVVAVVGVATAAYGTVQQARAKKAEHETLRESRNAADAATGMGVGLEYIREALRGSERRISRLEKQVEAQAERIDAQATEIRACHTERDQLRRELADLLGGRG